MNFLETVRRVRSHLEEQGRVSLRALERDSSSMATPSTI